MREGRAFQGVYFVTWGRHSENLEVFEPPLYFGLYHILEGRPMMRCENCSHECTVVDFAAFRNLCEHLYLDALAKKSNSLRTSNDIPIKSGRNFQRLLPSAMERPSAREELLVLEN
jgi:hypothetical protein